MRKKKLEAISTKSTEAIANQTLSKVLSLKLDPTPDLYMVWYTYFSNNNLDLNQKVDKILAENKDNIRAIHFHEAINYLKKETYILGEFYEESQDSILQTFQTAQAFSNNTKSLGNFIHQTSNDITKGDRQIITEIQIETDNILSENARLQEIIDSERIKMLQLQEKLLVTRSELITDSLTNIHNRRHFDICLKDTIKSSHLNEQPVCLFMFDIDHFKKFNDTYGHLVGDTVLKFVGHTMRTIFPDITHHLFRYGGEEFAIIFDNLSKAHSIKYAQMLSNAISKKEIIKKSTNEIIGSITISGGIAVQKKNDTAETLISRADIALYEAKNQGRNKINFAA